MLCIWYLDAEFAIWTGYKVSQRDWTVLLVCVALNGYNGVASYIWQKDGDDLDEAYPLLYTKATGKFRCTVTIPTVPRRQQKILKSKVRVFSVSDFVNHR